MHYHNTILKSTIYFLSCIILFASCTTGNKFASSFGKRKYNKGYYVDVAGKAPKVATNTAIPTQNDNTAKDIESTATALSLPVTESHLGVKAARVMQYVSAKLSAKAKTTSKAVCATPTKVTEAIKDGGGRHDTSGTSGDMSFGIAGFVFVMLSYVGVFFGLLFTLLSGITSTYITAALTLLLVSLAVYIVGVVCCLVSLSHDEDKHGFAIAGLVLAALPLIFFIIGFLRA